MSTCHRILTDPTKITRLQMARIMGVYGLPYDALFVLIARLPNPHAHVVTQSPTRDYQVDHHHLNNPLIDAHYASGQPERYRNGLPVVPLAPDEQRPVPANLNPDQLYEPQTPAQRRAGVPPIKRRMTEEEFSSYDPEPEIIHPKHLKDSSPDWMDWTNPVWSWWHWRLNTRPGCDTRAQEAAESRASAEFEGDETDRTKVQRTARRDEIMAALKNNQPVPPFDPADPRYVCEPAEPRRRGKGKKNKKDSSE